MQQLMVLTLHTHVHEWRRHRHNCGWARLRRPTIGAGLRPERAARRRDRMGDGRDRRPHAALGRAAASGEACRRAAAPRRLPGAGHIRRRGVEHRGGAATGMGLLRAAWLERDSPQVGHRALDLAERAGAEHHRPRRVAGQGQAAGVAQAAVARRPAPAGPRLAAGGADQGAPHARRVAVRYGRKLFRRRPARPDVVALAAAAGVGRAAHVAGPRECVAGGAGGRHHHRDFPVPANLVRPGACVRACVHPRHAYVRP